jgi:hypothetical protein
LHGQASDQLRLREERVSSGPPALNSASIIREVAPDARAITMGSSEPSVSPLPQVASTTLKSESENDAVSRRIHREDAESAKVSAATLPEPAQETGARADREADETAKVTPAAIPPSRTGAQERGAAKKAQRVVQTSKAHEAKRTNRSAVQPSSSGGEATARSNSAPKRNDKPTTAQRTRVAAAQSETSTPPTPPPGAAESVTEQRVHLLGIPLPTGRKVRECLLEWRC